MDLKPLKIALIGYGKMGKTIEAIARRRGDEIVLAIDAGNQRDWAQIHMADVAIEFSMPGVAFANVEQCLRARIPVVCGTTGWLDRMPDVHALTHELGGAFFYASNYSLGVNVFFAVNRHLAGLMRSQPDYEVSIIEIHHLQKLDAPSGTAISLAGDILSQSDRKKKWVNHASGLPEELSIISKREDAVPGTHLVTYTSPVDTIEIKHTAHSREGFAVGVLTAAHWLHGKTGVFGMHDLLGF